MFKKLTKTDREKILATRTGVLPMSAIDAMLLSQWKHLKEQKEQEIQKSKLETKPETKLRSEADK